MGHGDGFIGLGILRMQHNVLFLCLNVLISIGSYKKLLEGGVLTSFDFSCSDVPSYTALGLPESY